MRAFGRSMALSVAALAALALPLFVSSPAFAAGCSSGDQVADKYCAMGAATSVLGAPVSAEYSVGSGRGRDYQGGSILWSAPTGAHEVHGAIVGDYRTVGGPGSLLGFPLTDETGTPDGVGRFNHFAGGSVYWTPVTGAHEVHGAIRAEWVATGWERGSLGYPVTDETATGGGRFNRFTGGSVSWTPSTGAHEVHGLIGAKYLALGAENSLLGFPLTDETGTPYGVGRFNHFAGGSVYWTPSTGAHEVHGSIRATWAARGWETGSLGYPVSDEYGVAAGRESDFTGGFLHWEAASGTIKTGAGQVLAPGVAQQSRRDPAGPFAISVTTVDPAGSARLAAGLAQDQMPGTEVTSSIASRYGAIAATNGGYFTTSGGPVHAYAQAGHIIAAPGLVENNMVDQRDGSLRIGGPNFTMTVSAPVGARGVVKVNAGAPAASEIAAYTPEGGTLSTPPAGGHCEVRVHPSAPVVAPDGSTTSVGNVDAVSCATALATSGGTVLATPAAGTLAPYLATLTLGTQIRLSWSLGWPGVFNAVGGNAHLVVSGAVNGPDVDGTDPFFARNPRTGVGQARDGRLLLVTVDGRQSGYSDGMTLREFANLFTALGADSALNLDGGGSTTMTHGSTVINRPSDAAGQRPVSNALMVLPPAPPAVRVYQPTVSSASVPPVGSTPETDPASVGGLAAAMASRGATLTPQLSGAASTFRASR